MMKLLKFVITVIFISLFANAALAGNDVVARVNGKPLTAFELNEEFQDILPIMGAYHGGMSKEKIAEIREKALSNLIEKELQYQYALEKGLSVPAKDIESEFTEMQKRFGSAANFKEALKKSSITKEELKGFISKRLLTVKAKDHEVTAPATLSDSDIKEYYEKNKGTFNKPVEFRASHILIGVEPSANKEEREAGLKSAKEVLAKVKSGEDFATLAMKYSTDQATAPIGGDIGPFHKGMAEESVEKAVLALKVGEVSDVVETIYGYHIIMLTGLKPAAQLTFDEVKADIKKKLEKKKAEELYNAWMDGLRSKAKIEIVKK